MRVTIKRNSKKFLFLLFFSIFALIGGIITIFGVQITSFVNGLYLILAGIGLLFFTLSISATDQKSFEQWFILSGIFYSVALLCGSLISFRYGQIITAKIILLCGIIVILLTIYSIISILRRGKQRA